MSGSRSHVNDSGKDNFAPRRKPRKPIRTLVVDDSPRAIGAIRGLLKNRSEIELVGFAGDGEEGVSQAEDLQPDLILMDLQMPKLDGLSAIRLVRSCLLRVRIIVITVNHGEELRQACQKGGADGFVVKDRLYPDLLAEIHRIFGGHAPECGAPLIRC